MSGGGTDPFSNTTTRNILQHIISPKVVSDGASGYAVKTDIINIDNVYVNDNLYVDTLTIQDNTVTNADKLVLSTDGSKTYITSTTSAGNRSELIVTTSGAEIKNQDNGGNGTLLLQTDTSGNGYVRAGYSGTGIENLYLGTQNTNSVTIAPSGNVSVGGTITASNLKRYTETGVTYSGGYYSFTNVLIPTNSPAVYSFLMYSSDSFTLEGRIIVGINFGGMIGSSESSGSPVYSLGTTGSSYFPRQSVDYTTTFNIIVQQIA